MRSSSSKWAKVLWAPVWSMRLLEMVRASVGVSTALKMALALLVMTWSGPGQW